MAKRRTPNGRDVSTIAQNAGDETPGEPPPAFAFENLGERCNAELQLSDDAVGTWLLLVPADGRPPLALTCFGPDRAGLRDQVAAELAAHATGGLAE